LNNWWDLGILGFLAGTVKVGLPRNWHTAWRYRLTARRRPMSNNLLVDYVLTMRWIPVWVHF